VVSLLLAKGAQIGAVDEDGEASLHEAAIGGHPEVVKLLLAGGSDISGVDKLCKTPLHWAASQGCSEVVKLLLAEGAQIGDVDVSGRTPLHWAAHGSHPEVVSLLLAGGADVEASDLSGKTPLHLVGHSEVARLLLAGGAQTGAIDQNGRTPLHLAASKGHPEVVRMLVAGGAVTGAVDENGSTPLHEAARGCYSKMDKLLTDADHDRQDAFVGEEFGYDVRDYPEVVRLLLAGGSQAKTVDKNGCTPLSHVAWDSPKMRRLAERAQTRAVNKILVATINSVQDQLYRAERGIITEIGVTKADLCGFTSEEMIFEIWKRKRHDSVVILNWISS